MKYKYYTVTHQPHWIYAGTTTDKHTVLWYDPMQPERGWFTDDWANFINCDKFHRIPDLSLVLAGINLS